MPRGRPFENGRSGNPGGRPKVVVEVRELARRYATEAAEALAKIMDDEKAPAAVPVSAASALPGRANGRAPRHVGLEGSIDQQITPLVEGLDHRPEPPGGPENPDTVH